MYKMCESSVSMRADILKTHFANSRKLICLKISLETVTLHANSDHDPLAWNTGAVHFQFIFFNYSAITKWNECIFGQQLDTIRVYSYPEYQVISLSNQWVIDRSLGKHMFWNYFWNQSVEMVTLNLLIISLF